jgi:hypothetical protein
MIHCGLFEIDDASMAHFRGGLNREIQDILDYKEYNDMTILFAYACKAEREVQGHRSKTYSNSFAGRSPATSSAPALPAPSTTSTTTRAAGETCSTTVNRRSSRHRPYTGYSVSSL